MGNFHNNKKMLINEQEVLEEPFNLSQYFKEKRKELQEECGEGLRKFYPMEEIAKSLCISKEMLQQKLYGKKPMTRYWLIAISAAHGLDSGETDIALKGCGEPRLDAEIPREDFLIEYLYEHKRHQNGIEEVNCALRNKGYQELNVCHHRREGGKVRTLSGRRKKTYEVTRKVIRTYLDEGDQYDSLETAFDFRYKCVAMALLEKDKCNKYVLEAYSDGYLFVTAKGDFSKRYKDINDTGEFRDYFSELLALAKTEQYKVEAQLYDSRNYQGRLGADLKNDSIHIFYEEYNYALPERNEYYLMEYVNRHYRLSVSHQSMFMSEYLSEAEYEEHYRTQPKILRTIYESMEEIEYELENFHLSSYYKDVLLRRKYAYKKLTKVVANALEEIRNRTLFIRNFDMIWDNPWQVCEYYHLEKEFGCIYDKEYDEIIDAKSEAKASGENGQFVTLSFSELRRAFELGCVDSNQICRIKESEGSIESVL